MQALGLVGSIAFSLASAVVGVRLLRLARRTRQTPELAMGLAFVSSGAIGFFFSVIADVARRDGADPAVVARLTQVAMLFFFAGYLGLAVGAAQIFRPREHWPRGAVAAIGATLLGATIGMLRQADVTPGSASEIASWVGIATGSVVFGWTTAESLLLYARMRKRLRLGLAEPAIADRVRLWAVGMAGAWAMTIHAVVFRVAAGTNLMPDGQRLLSSGFGMVAAVAIWLAFFPPAAYRKRFAPA